MKRSTIGDQVRTILLSVFALSVLAALAASTGCGPSAPPPVDGRLQIENFAKWRIAFGAKHNNRSPKDQAEFQAFIERTLQERGETFDRTALFVSPRDNKEWVMRYGPESAKLGLDAILVHEQEGYDGKILVATVGGRSREVDAAELPALLEVK